MEGDPDAARSVASSTPFQSTPSAWRETDVQLTPLHALQLFQSTPSAWRETVQILRSQVNPIFQSTPSVWRETLSGFHSFQCFTISIHSLRMEGDNCSHRVTLQNVHFNPLPPYGGRLIRSYRFIWTAVFQSTPSVWRETENSVDETGRQHISIHSLRMEGDI